MKKINRVAVLGSGTMGNGIAAHLANCGISSLVLKVTPAKSGDTPDKRKAALRKTKPSLIYQDSALDLIEFGNLEEDAHRLAECDWICETVTEDLEIKKELFAKLAPHRKKGSILSTNTSGISVGSITEHMDEDMRKNFLGTHFFNPPRYLKLMELVPGPETQAAVMETMVNFCENVLGKGVVHAKDTPNFIANRTLVFMVQYILHELETTDLSFEEIDALTGPVVGHSALATFRTVDLVGVDVFAKVVANVYDRCPELADRDMFVMPYWVQAMLDHGWLGTKSGSGFYKKTKKKDEKGKSIVLSLKRKTLEYGPRVKPGFACLAAAKKVDSLEEKVRLMYKSEDEGSRFLWRVFAHSVSHVGAQIPEIANDIVSIDNAVKWGFAWDLGLFEKWDILGFKYVCDRMKTEGIPLPRIAEAIIEAGGKGFYSRDLYGRRCYFDLATKRYKQIPRHSNALVLDDLKILGGVLKGNESASLVDLDDGILCVEFHTKMNTIDAGVLEMVEQGVELVNGGKYDGLVIGNQGQHFCAGANLTLLLTEIKQGNWADVRHMVREFQRVNMALRFCRGPVVAAPHHFTFGGGIEMTQHAARAVIAGETYGGLIEMGVGLIPAGGGTKEMLRRALAYVPSTLVEGNPFPYVRRAFEAIGTARVSTSGPELIDLGYLSEEDIVCRSSDVQIKRAKDVCRGMVAAGYEPPRPATLVVLGERTRAAFSAAVFNLEQSGHASEHDALIASHVAHILTGGDHYAGSKITEQDVLDLECEAFLSLCGTEKTQQRIAHMLKTGKPLRN
ncbi:MAG: 3-hydroxyacyl-CoA dehydrogenase [Nitrospiraceae bacterium]|nr:3-hydroxyacyl-CoA dehydrogenase [Nitrospiraceae bacterium]